MLNPWRIRGKRTLGGVGAPSRTRGVRRGFLEAAGPAGLRGVVSRAALGALLVGRWWKEEPARVSRSAGSRGTAALWSPPVGAGTVPPAESEGDVGTGRPHPQAAGLRRRGALLGTVSAHVTALLLLDCHRGPHAAHANSGGASGLCPWHGGQQFPDPRWHLCTETHHCLWLEAPCCISRGFPAGRGTRQLLPPGRWLRTRKTAQPLADAQ